MPGQPSQPALLHSHLYLHSSCDITGSQHAAQPDAGHTAPVYVQTPFLLPADATPEEWADFVGVPHDSQRPVSFLMFADPRFAQVRP